MLPTICMAYDALVTGHGLRDIALAGGVELGTAWNYATQSAEHMDPGVRMRIVPNLVSKDFFTLLQTMHANTDARLGGTLKDLFAVWSSAPCPPGVSSAGASIRWSSSGSHASAWPIRRRLTMTSS